MARRTVVYLGVTLALFVPNVATAFESERMTTYGAYSAPTGFNQFCARNSGQCASRRASRAIETARDGTVVLTHERRAELDRVNRAVNAAIRQVTDYELYGREEYWALPTSGVGDCEDIALAKRQRLLAEGWPSSALLMTIVRDWAGEGHAVLTVRTGDGDLVLDNRTDSVKRWDRTGYIYYIRQAETNPRAWVLITHGVPMDTASN